MFRWRIQVFLKRFFLSSDRHFGPRFKNATMYTTADKTRTLMSIAILTKARPPQDVRGRGRQRPRKGWGRRRPAETWLTHTNFTSISLTINIENIIFLYLLILVILNRLYLFVYPVLLFSIFIALFYCHDLCMNRWTLNIWNMHWIRKSNNKWFRMAFYAKSHYRNNRKPK